MRDADGVKVRAHLDFPSAAEQPLVLGVGLSAVSAAAAEQNLTAEAPLLDFDSVRKSAHDEWSRHLSRIQIDSPSPSIRQAFYTALYHSMLSPTLYNDADGSFRGPDNTVHSQNHFQFYSTFSLWDAFRAEHPLLTVIEPERVNDFVQTLLTMAQQSVNILPMWVLAGHDTGTMIGYHAVPVIADAYAKGFRGFDASYALTAMQATALAAKNGQDLYTRLGYVPTTPGGRTRGAAKTLEFSYDDACIAQMAAALGRKDIDDQFSSRAYNYRKVFDPATRFFRGKTKEGTFSANFDPLLVDPDDYAEANAWQYAFAVLQDVAGMIDLYGGHEAFTRRLDEFFNQPSVIHHYIPDISGLIGQYAHGNEPCHHVAYLYALAGDQSKTASLVRRILQMQYDTTPAGICGNDDCGQMSAW